MKIYIPNSAWIGNIDPFLESFDNSDNTYLDITFNKEWIFVHPAVLCMICSLGLYIQNEGGKINLQEMTAKSKNYFERIGLFRVLQLRSTINIKEHDSSGRFIPLTLIKNSNDLDKFIKDMIPLLHTDQEQVDPIRYVISELVRNVLEHAKTPVGAVVCAQYYPKSKTIRIGVADCGIGIKESINESWNAKDDLEALKLALTPGITGTTSQQWGGTADNAGAGLFFIKSIAKVNRDFFMIYSGKALYKLLKTNINKEAKLVSDPFQDKCSTKKDLPKWQGTVVGVDLSIKKTKDFEQLLEIIRNFYFKELKEEQRSTRKKPRFTYGRN